MSLYHTWKDLICLNLKYSRTLEACGLPKDEALKIIETRAFSQAVDVDWYISEELGIMVAPTYLLNEVKLSGSPPFEKLEALMITNNIPKKSMT
jgi:predicted DsbA family dithiol-disulfide isomerase